MDEVSHHPPPPPAASLPRGNYTDITSDGRGQSPEPYSNTGYNYNYPPGAALGGGAPLEHDEVPLTREETQPPDDPYGYGYGHGLTAIEEEDDPRPTTGATHTGIHSPRGGGGGPFFQQNRGPGWF